MRRTPRFTDTFHCFLLFLVLNLRKNDSPTRLVWRARNALLNKVWYFRSPFRFLCFWTRRMLSTTPSTWVLVRPWHVRLQLTRHFTTDSSSSVVTILFEFFSSPVITLPLRCWLIVSGSLMYFRFRVAIALQGILAIIFPTIFHLFLYFPFLFLHPLWLFIMQGRVPGLDASTGPCWRGIAHIQGIIQTKMPLWFHYLVYVLFSYSKVKIKYY